MRRKKKIIFCTYASIYSSKVLEPLLMDDEIEVVAIINSTRVFSQKSNLIQGVLTHLKTSGFRYACYLFLITDGFKWLQPVFAFKRWPLLSINGLAKKKNIPLLNTSDINDDDSIEFIKALNADVLLCAHFNQRLKAPLLSYQQLWNINIHPSLLPAYKGVDPVFYAMKDETVTLGVSLHTMNENFDEGKLLGQVRIDNHSNKSLLFNNCQLFEEGARLAVTWIKTPKKVPAPFYTNNTEQGNYDSWPTSLDVRDFKQKGKRLMHFLELWKQQ